MSYHQMQGLAKDRERELRRLARQGRSSRAPRGPAIRRFSRSKVGTQSAPVVRLEAPSVRPLPETKAG